MGLRTSAEVQRYRGAVQYRASSGTGRSGVSARFWQGFGHRTGPKGSGTAVGFIWADSRGLATILDPFRAILVILGPTPYLRLQHLSCLNSRHLSCLSSRHLSCLNSRHLSCLNRRHLSCLNWCAPCGEQYFSDPQNQFCQPRSEGILPSDSKSRVQNGRRQLNPTC